MPVIAVALAVVGFLAVTLIIVGVFVFVVSNIAGIDMFAPTDHSALTPLDDLSVSEYLTMTSALNFYH